MAITVDVNATVAAGDNVIVAAVANKRIVVLNYVLTGVGAGGTLLIKSNANILGRINLGVGVAIWGQCGAQSELPQIITNLGEELRFTTGTGQTIAGMLTYELNTG